MNRIMATARWDIAIQARNGFYAATAFVTIFWAIIFINLPRLNLDWLLPPLVVGNLLLGTFYFIGGLVLLEKGEGTLMAQAITPLRLGEYLLAKILTLLMPVLAETLVIVVLVAGGHFTLLPLVAGAVLAGAMYCLAGFIAVAPYPAINEYLLPSGMYAALLWIPLLAYMAHWHHWILYLHPFSAPLTLVRAAFEDVPLWQVAYGVIYGVVWLVLLYQWSSRVFKRSRLNVQGGG